MIRTYLLDLPLNVKGYTVKNIETDEQIIVLNSRLNYETNLEAYLHEIGHEDDFDRGYTVNELETVRHNKRG